MCTFAQGFSIIVREAKCTLQYNDGFHCAHSVLAAIVIVKERMSENGVQKLNKYYCTYY